MQRAFEKEDKLNPSVKSPEPEPERPSEPVQANPNH